MKAHYSEAEIPVIAGQILTQFPDDKVYYFRAEMGSGKTTLIKELCRQLGCAEHLSSPTYSIINEYKSKDHTIYHMDLYRVKNIQELLDLGIEDLIHSGNYCFIEWPELAEEVFDCPHLLIEIEPHNNIRYISVSKIES